MCSRILAMSSLDLELSFFFTASVDASIMLRRTSVGVRRETSLIALSYLATSAVYSCSVCRLLLNSSTRLSVSAERRYENGRYAPTSATVSSMFISTISCSRCFALVTKSSSAVATVSSREPCDAPPLPISASTRGIVFIIATKWSTIERTALVTPWTDGENLKPSPSTTIRTMKRTRESTRSEWRSTLSGRRLSGLANCSKKATYAATDACSSPRSWLNMSAETVASNSDEPRAGVPPSAAAVAAPAAGRGCSAPSAPAAPWWEAWSLDDSLRKISRTAGNHFFLSICTTFSQWACCMSLKRSTSIAATAGIPCTLARSRCW